MQWLQVAQTLRAPDAQGVWVRGASLCEWAAQWWQLAGGDCREVHNALDALLLIVPALERDEAKITVGALEAAGVAAGASLGEMLAALFPDFGDEGAFWRREIGAHNRLEFAASWLLWLEGQSEIEASRAKLIAQQAAIWRDAQRESGELFPATPNAARGALRCWLGLEPHNARGAFAAREAFPAPLPQRWREEAREFYARLFTRECDQTGAALALWRAYERTNAPVALRKIAAQTLAHWLNAHPQQLSATLLVGLEPWLSRDDGAMLRDLQPPPAPPVLPGHKPSDAPLVLEWVKRNYLPFRAWQCARDNDAARVAALRAASEFGDWFLKFYAAAAVGAARQWLQINRASRLRYQTRGELTFWVIADGLGWLDARELAQLITQSNPRFSLLETQALLGTIPTITSFAKPSLRHSSWPDGVDEASDNECRRETEVAGHREAAGALQSAGAGDLVIWKPLEPDATYHENAEASIVRHRVAGALNGLARQIVEAALLAPADVPLQIVVTTDHGRMLGASARVHPAPPGYSSHGRAAYGDARPDENALANLIWLDPDVYRCKSHVVIAADEGAFLTNETESAAPRAGALKFAHGGIFPEEVVVPWLVFGRDAKPVALSAQLTGKGRAGRQSRARLRLSNASNRALTVQSLELRYGTRQAPSLALEPIVVAPFGNGETEITLADWPGTAEARDARATVTLRAPDGVLVKNEVSVELQTEELQTREDILGDLI